MSSRFRPRAGFTLLEVMLACLLMGTAVLALMALIPETVMLTETTEEGNLAMQASLQVSEAVRQYADQNFAYVWRVYNSAPADDPNGAGTAPVLPFLAPGNTFTVGLAPNQLENAAGSTAVGTVTFFTDETLNTTASNKVGLPKDLDGDNAVTNTDVSATYTLLPFEVAVDWKDRRGLIRHTEIFSQVVDY